MKRIMIIAAMALAGASVAHADFAAPPDDCRGVDMASVAHLDPHGDNNLSVHASPYHPSAATEIDELFTGDRVCVIGSRGPWLRIQYTRDGRNWTGWAHERYLEFD